jgi:hypothetical protein
VLTFVLPYPWQPGEAIVAAARWTCFEPQVGQQLKSPLRNLRGRESGERGDEAID